MATDASNAMVAAATRKTHAYNVGDRVSVRVLSIDDAAATIAEGPFDAVHSNFGGLNCVGDLGAAMRSIATLVRPGGVVVLVVMGPFVPWELAWFAAKGQPSKAIRRLRGKTTWRGMTIAYPSPRKLIRSAAPWFTADRVLPIGIALPPSYVNGWISRRPRMLRWLAEAEDVLAVLPGSAWLGDHYLIVLRRR